MRILKSATILFFVVLIGQVLSVDLVFASNTDGTIDSTYKYAWSENTGWINFGCDNCGVQITDSGLSGYALGENTGWLYLGDITNDGEGNLSGYAWSENAGWLKFNPTYGGVIINSSGEFTGSALAENIGWIIFDCDTSACVKTDWRPQSARVCTSWTYSDWSSCSNGQQTRTIVSSSPAGCTGGSPVLSQSCSAGGGGGLPSGAYNAPITPEGGFKILINNDDQYTDKREVILKLIAGSDTARMAISNNPDFSTGTGQIPYQSSYSWDICQGKQECNEGVYTVYIQFYTQYGVSSGVISDSIVFRKEKPIVKIPEIIKKIPEIIKKIPEIFKPKPPEEVKPAEVPVEEIVPEEAPLTMQGKWQLLPSKPIREFVLAPLPKEIRKLAEKFPELGETLKQVGITKVTDIRKLRAVKLFLPGLKELAAIPTEIVFAKTAGGLIDLDITLTISEQGKPEQRIQTISGKPLQLVVKPDKPVKSVKGYVVWKSKKISKLEIPLRSLLGSIFFAPPSFAKEHNPTEVEERLLLLEFEYTDPDADGIYTAEIQAPIVEGEYEIITVMDFEDPELGMKEIRLITVVDPEGYVYTKIKNQELRIKDVIVSLYWLNRETKQYQLWPAKEYQQENPQITDITGKYSFLVPEGTYYFKAEAPGYLIYGSEAFEVTEGTGIHKNIELKNKLFWLRFDWRTILLIFIAILLAIVTILLFYNFYRDKITKKLIEINRNSWKPRN